MSERYESYDAMDVCCGEDYSMDEGAVGGTLTNARPSLCFFELAEFVECCFRDPDGVLEPAPDWMRAELDWDFDLRPLDSFGNAERAAASLSERSLRHATSDGALGSLSSGGGGSVAPARARDESNPNFGFPCAQHGTH